jgi:predicted amidohydrolase
MNRVIVPIMLTIGLFLGIAGPGACEEPTQRPMTVKVAAIQCSSGLAALKANTAKLTSLVEKAAGEGAKIIVLPEAAVTGYLSQDLRSNWQVAGKPIESSYTGVDPSPHAEEVPGKSTRHFCEVAKRLGVYITVPLVEVVHSAKSEVKEPTSDSSTYFNTVCLVSPKGEIVAHYRKLTPWPVPEKSWATPGDRGVQVYDTEYGRVGLAICYDIHTILEKYGPKHIWALLYSIAWVDTSNPADWFWHQLPSRVAKFNHYLIGANWSVDQKQPWNGYGFSEILSPEGEILAASHKLYGSDIVYATIKTAWAGSNPKSAPSTTDPSPRNIDPNKAKP